MTVMATTSSQMSVDQNRKDQEVEGNLVNYLQTIMKYQIVPAHYKSLQKLVTEASSKLKLHEYVKEKYPGDDFLIFLRKYPEVFIVNPDGTVQVTNASYCIQQQSRKQSNSGCDEVDSKVDKAEYVSDQESDSDSDT